MVSVVYDFAWLILIHLYRSGHGNGRGRYGCCQGVFPFLNLPARYFVRGYTPSAMG
jgi:hypothetical protein